MSLPGHFQGTDLLLIETSHNFHLQVPKSALSKADFGVFLAGKASKKETFYETVSISGDELPDEHKQYEKDPAALILSAAGSDAAQADYMEAS